MTDPMSLRTPVKSRCLLFLALEDDRRFVVATTPTQKPMAEAVCRTIFAKALVPAEPELIAKCMVEAPALQTVHDMVHQCGFFILAAANDATDILKPYKWANDKLMLLQDTGLVIGEPEG